MTEDNAARIRDVSKWYSCIEELVSSKIEQAQFGLWITLLVLKMLVFPVFTPANLLDLILAPCSFNREVDVVLSWTNFQMTGVIYILYSNFS